MAEARAARAGTLALRLAVTTVICVAQSAPDDRVLRVLRPMSGSWTNRCMGRYWEWGNTGDGEILGTGDVQP